MDLLLFLNKPRYKIQEYHAGEEVVGTILSKVDSANVKVNCKIMTDILEGFL